MPVIKLKNRPGITKLSKAPEKRATMDDILDRVDVIRGGKGEDGKTPVKGVDYFTKDEINAWLKSVTPIKGKHYFDGEKGEMGETGLPGKDGKDADEDIIIAKILSEVPKPKNGKDGKDAISPELEEFKKEIISELQSLKGKKLSITDIEELENRLNVLNAKVEKNYGGHGGTMRQLTVSNGGLTNTTGYTYTLNTPYPQRKELEVYVGGGRTFFENGDWTTTVTGGNRVTSITFLGNAAASIASGATINIAAK